MGEMATSPLPYRGAPPLQSGGQNQKWPTSGQIGYLTPAVSGSPTASERGAKSEVAHKWAKWLPHPCRIGEPHRFRAGGKIRSGPQVGKLATSPLPYRGAPPLQSAMFVFGIFNNEKTKHWEPNIALGTKHFTVAFHKTPV